MPKKLQHDRQNDFSGGMNTIARGEDMPRNQVRQALDCYIDKSGSLFRRPGYQRLKATSLTPNGFTAWIPVVGAATTQLVLTESGTSPTAVYISTIASTIIPPQAFTNTGTYTNASNLNHITMARLVDGSGVPALYFASSASKMGKLNGTTNVVTTISLPASVDAQIVFTHNQRLFGLGTDVGGVGGTRADWLSYSGLNNGDSLGDTTLGGGRVRLDTQGGRIVDGMSVGGTLFVLNANGISRFTGWSADDIAITQSSVTASAGLGFNKTFCHISLGTVAYVLADNGYVYALFEDGSMKVMNPTFPLPHAVSTSWGGVMYDRENQTIVWSTTGGDLYIYNMLVDAWTRGTFLGTAASANVACMGNGIAAGTASFCLFGGLYPYWYRPDVANKKDDVLSDGTGGTAITMTVQPRIFGDETTFKAPTAIRIVHALGSTVAAAPIVNLGGNACTLHRSFGGYQYIHYVPPADTTAPKGATSFAIDLQYSESSDLTGGLSAVEVDFFDYGNRM